MPTFWGSGPGHNIPLIFHAFKIKNHRILEFSAQVRIWREEYFESEKPKNTHVSPKIIAEIVKNSAKRFKIHLFMGVKNGKRLNLNRMI